MRPLVALSGLWACTALAQGGVWGGYVTGWQSAPLQVPSTYIGNTQLQPAVRFPAYVAPSYGYGYGWPAYSSFQTDEDTARAQQLAQQQAIAAQQAQYDREREAARAREIEAQLLAQQQQVAQQQLVLAQQQQQAAIDAQARLAEREAKQLELQQKELAEKQEAAAHAEAEAKPREKGPAIHRWVDEDGVVHYSTKPRSAR